MCTLIDESEVLEAQAAAAIAEDLQRALPDLRIGLVHGRMKPQEKQAIMAEFKAANLDLLVATTVIEVGVDVPNASLMIIENSERLVSTTSSVTWTCRARFDCLTLRTNV